MWSPTQKKVIFTNGTDDDVSGNGNMSHSGFWDGFGCHSLRQSNAKNCAYCGNCIFVVLWLFNCFVHSRCQSVALCLRIPTCNFETDNIHAHTKNIYERGRKVIQY